MAERRMFAKSIVDSDAFLEMPQSSQLLYFHLGMRADDDGFVNSIKKIISFTGCREDDMKILISKKFIIPFESGVIVIKHWRMNNFLRNDRYKETNYKDEKALLQLDENQAYKLNTQTGIPLVYPDKYSIDKISIDKINNKAQGHKETVLNLIETYNNPILKEALLAFNEMRNKIKKPLTARALNMIIKKLEGLSLDENIQIQIINQSTINCYQDIYPLKQQNNYKNNVFNNDKPRDYNSGGGLFSNGIK